MEHSYRTPRLLACLSWALLAPLTAAAEDLPDPTRPPPQLESTAITVPGSAATPVAPAGLQSVILRKGGKPTAIINGTPFELGARVGEAKLVKIGEDHVVLQGPAGKEVVRLTPAVLKKQAAPEAPDTKKKTERRNEAEK